MDAWHQSLPVVEGEKPWPQFEASPQMWRNCKTEPTAALLGSIENTQRPESLPSLRWVVNRWLHPYDFLTPYFEGKLR